MRNRRRDGFKREGKSLLNRLEGAGERDVRLCMIENPKRENKRCTGIISHREKGDADRGI